MRKGSESKLPNGCTAVIGNALDQSTFSHQISPADTFIQLVGVPHPSPAKARQFREVDLVSVRESVAAAVSASIQHFIYLSVAQPSPVMKAYLAVRAEGEALIRDSSLNATFIRPLYVLGPGHWWPYALLPFFWICQRLPPTKAAANRLCPVTLKATILALINSVENPGNGIRVMEACEIANSSLPTANASTPLSVR